MGFAISDLELKSAAFKSRATIPQRHTGEGEDISPVLEWANVPEGTRSFVLICHDPDAPLIKPGVYGFVHWVLYKIPGFVTSLPEGTEEYTKGVNDLGKEGYNGPMPPEGHGPHHYFFWLLALNEELNLEPGLTLWQLLERIEPHVIGMNRLVGIYER